MDQKSIGNSAAPRIPEAPYIAADKKLVRLKVNFLLMAVVILVHRGSTILTRPIFKELFASVHRRCGFPGFVNISDLFIPISYHQNSG